MEGPGTAPSTGGGLSVERHRQLTGAGIGVLRGLNGRQHRRQPSSPAAMLGLPEHLLVRARAPRGFRPPGERGSPGGSATGWSLWCWPQAMLMSSNRIRHDTPSTARWWMMSARAFGPAAQTARTSRTGGGVQFDRAATSASSESRWTVVTQSTACAAPGQALRASTRRRRHRSPATARGVPVQQRPEHGLTSASVTAAGACRTRVWLNSSIGPSTSCSQRMIGVAATGPDALVDCTGLTADTLTTVANRATVCLTKMFAGPGRSGLPPAPAPRPASTGCCPRRGRRTSRRRPPVRCRAPRRRCRAPARLAVAGARYRSWS